MNNEKPTITAGEHGEIHKHPAFGMITMTEPTGGNSTLFGSDIGHNRRIRITVQHATLKRDLSHDWIHSTAMPLVEFEMSHAQFAQFITSVGKGCGTPVTLTYAPETVAVEVPGIEKVESKHETFRREIQANATRVLEGMRFRIAALEEMINSGSLSKPKLRDLCRDMQITVGNAPSNMAFVVAQAEEALEKATSDAKIEVETFIDSQARRLGLERIDQLLMLGKEG